MKFCWDNRGVCGCKKLYFPRVTSICLSSLLKSMVIEVMTLPESWGAEGEMGQRLARASVSVSISEWIPSVSLKQHVIAHIHMHVPEFCFICLRLKEKVGVLGLSPQSACRDLAFVARWGAIIIHDPPTKADGQPEAASPSLLCVWWTGDEGRRQDHDPSTWVSHWPQTQ